MPLLAGVLLGDLQLDGFVGFLEPGEQRRRRFACLEVDRSVFDLNDDVVVELSVERMKMVVSGVRPIILWPTPVEMMVVDKCAIEDDAVVRLERARDYVARVGGRPVVRRGAETPL